MANKKFKDLTVTTDIDGLLGAAQNENGITAGNKFKYSKNQYLNDINPNSIVPTQEAVKQYVDSLKNIAVSVFSVSVIWRDGAITESIEEDALTFAMHYTTINHASLVSGNTFVIQIDEVKIATLVAGTHFLIGATASEDAINLAGAINSSAVAPNVIATPNAIGAGTLVMTDKIGGQIGNSYLVSTNNPSAFILIANRFFGGGSTKVNIPARTVRVTDVTSNPKTPIVKDIDLPAENNVPIKDLALQYTYFTTIFDSNLDVIPFEISPGIFSNYTQTQDEPITPENYRKEAVSGVAIHSMGINIENLTDFDGSAPTDFGAAIKDVSHFINIGGTDQGSVIPNTGLTVKSTQGIVYAVGISPNNPLNPNSRIFPEAILDEYSSTYRKSGGGFIVARMIQNGGVPENPAIYDNGAATQPAIPINTRPVGVVLANQWSARFWYKAGVTGEILKAYGQKTYPNSPPNITDAIYEFQNEYIANPALVPNYLIAIAYEKNNGYGSFVTDPNDGNYNYCVYDYKQLRASGLGASSTFSPRTEPKIVYFSKTGASSNNGTNINDAIDTLTNALTKAKSYGTSNVVLYCPDGETYNENLTGGNALTDGIHIDAPNAIITGNLEISGSSVICCKSLGTTGNTLTISGSAKTIRFLIKQDIRYLTLTYTGSGNGLSIWCTQTYISTIAYGVSASSNYYFANAVIINSLSISDTSKRNIIDLCCERTSGTLNITNLYVYLHLKILDGLMYITGCFIESIIGVLNSNAFVDETTSGAINVLMRKNGVIQASTQACAIFTNERWSAVIPVTDTWYQIGEQVITSIPATARYTVNVIVNNQVSILNILYLGGNPAYVYAETCIEYGEISAIRPLVRIYDIDASGLSKIYLKIPANAIFFVIAHDTNKQTINVKNILVNSGTGTDPNNISGCTLKYDSIIDQAGYLIPKELNWSGCFTSGTSYLKIGKPFGNVLFLYFTNLATIGDGTSDIIKVQLSIPDKYKPTQGLIETKVMAFVDNTEYENCIVEITSDGMLSIMRPGRLNFDSINGQPIGFKDFTLGLPISDT